MVDIQYHNDDSANRVQDSVVALSLPIDGIFTVHDAMESLAARRRWVGRQPLNLSLNLASNFGRHFRFEIFKRSFCESESIEGGWHSLGFYLCKSRIQFLAAHQALR